VIYPHKLEQIAYSDLKDLHYEVAVLPIGATEPHGMHLPYGTDFLTAVEIADRICGLANEQKARTISLPALPYGVDTNQMEFPLAMNVNQSTINLVVSDLLDSLEHHGIRKVMILNGHGGNEFKGFLREEFGKREQFVCMTNWWTVGEDAYDDIFEIQDDHAGEMETSIALSIFPELVKLDRASDGATRKTDYSAINEGWVKITRPWHLLTKDSTSTDPRGATADKGKRYLDVVTERLAAYLTELSNTPYSPDMPYSIK
jgi:creatinine amidohydrolase